MTPRNRQPLSIFLASLNLQCSLTDAIIPKSFFFQAEIHAGGFNWLDVTSFPLSLSDECRMRIQHTAEQSHRHVGNGAPFCAQSLTSCDGRFFALFHIVAAGRRAVDRGRVNRIFPMAHVILKGLSLQKSAEIIQLIEYPPLFLTYLTVLKGVSLDFPSTF